MKTDIKTPSLISKNVALIIPFMTEHYERSKLCEEELNLAVKLKIPIIPILAQKNWKKTKGSWLSVLTAGKIPLNFNDDGKFIETFEILFDNILDLVPAFEKL